MKLLVHAGLLVLAFGLGYLLRGPLPGSHPATAPAAGAIATAGNSAPSPQYPAHDPKDPAVTFTGNAQELLAHLVSNFDYLENYAFLVRTLEPASAEHLASLAAELASMSNNRSWVSESLRFVIKYWSKLDSPAAIAWAKSLPKQKSAQALSSALSALAETDSAQALALAQSLPDKRSRDQAQTAILTVMAKKDPAAAFALLKPWNEGASYALFDLWAKQDPLAAQHALATLPSGQLRDQASSSFYRSWASADPLAAAASASALGNRSQRTNALSNILSSWANEDPTAAWEYCQSLPANDPARRSQQSVLSRMAQNDPAKALSLLQQLPQKDREEGLSSVFRTWAQTDPQASLAYAASLTKLNERAAALGNIGSTLDLADSAAADQIFAQFPSAKDRKSLLQSYIGNHSQRDAASCVALLKYLDPVSQQRILNDSNLFGDLGNQDPEAALKLAEQFPGEQARNQMANIFTQLAQNDPEKGARLLAAMPEDEQLRVMPNYLSGLANQDVNQAMKLAQAMPEGQRKEEGLTRVLNIWATQDANAVLAWAQTATGAAREAALNGVLQQKTSGDPATALTFFNSLLNSGQPEDLKVAKARLSSVSECLYREGAVTVVQWMNQLTDEGMRNTAIADLSSRWPRDDPMEASVWIRGLPDGTAKNQAVENLISGIKQTDPESALVWARSLPEVDQQQNRTRDVFRTWLVNSPTAAQQALLTAPLSQEAKDTLLKDAKLTP